MKDITDLKITVNSVDVLNMYNSAVADLCRFKNPVPAIKTLLDLETNFVMGQVFNGYINLWTTDRDDLQWSLESLTMLSTFDISDLHHREKMHIQVLKAWAKGDLTAASKLLDDILIEYPLDILALLSGHQLDFFLGDTINLLERVSRVLPSWDKESPLYGFLLGMLSFGLEENGRYELAEQYAKESVQRFPQDIWGIHAVAHALEMQNKFEEGAKFLQEHEQYWHHDNVMVSHVAIHQILFLLETGDLTKALEVYDNFVHPDSQCIEPMALVDASSVLWRLYLEGEALGDRMEVLAESWKQKSEQLFYSFNDAHAMIAFAATSDHDSARKLLDDIKEYVSHGDNVATNHRMSANVGLPVCEAIYAFTQGDYNTVVSKLMSIKTITAQFGGSHAQRDIIARTLLDAAIRANNKTMARALVNERLIARPNSPYNKKKLAQAVLMV